MHAAQQAVEAMQSKEDALKQAAERKAKMLQREAEEESELARVSTWEEAYYTGKTGFSPRARRRHISITIRLGWPGVEVLTDY